MDKGRLLKMLREAKNISQTRAAAIVGVTKQTLYKYENNIVTNIPSDVIERLASLYDTTPSYIMGWEDHDVQIDIEKSSDHEVVQAYYQRIVRMSIKDRELELINKYRAASEETKKIIDKILEI